MPLQDIIGPKNGRGRVVEIMKDLILSLFGDYVPVTNSTVTADGVIEEVVPGMAGVDWPWLMGVLLFAIVLYSFFRLVGVILRG